MENKVCGYCNEPITDQRYQYKWFPAEKGGEMKPIHSKHFEMRKDPPTTDNFKYWETRRKPNAEI